MIQKKQKTNVEAIRDIMEHSKYGGLVQAFVIEALAQYADKVAQSKASDYPENSMINPDSWIGVAKEIQEKLKDHLS